ncbi:MAG: hypothetical protein ACLR3R_16080 [Clostridium paraputrificum]
MLSFPLILSPRTSVDKGEAIEYSVISSSGVLIISSLNKNSYSSTDFFIIELGTNFPSGVITKKSSLNSS